MTRFSYKAINQEGRTVSGTLEAESRAAADNSLAARGLAPSSITWRGEGAQLPGLSVLKEKMTRIRAQDLILFTKQFRTMARAGVSMLTILQVLEEQTENTALRKVCSTMAHDIKEGSSLNRALSKHPRVFSHLYCSMVEAGEASGALPEVMERLIYIIEHEDKIKSDVKSALQYPVIVLLFLFVAFFVLLTFVIPKFVHIFEKASISLPIPTRICLFMYEALSGYWPLLLGGLSVVVIGLVLYLRTREGKYNRDKLLLRLPLIGPLFLKSAMSRFCSIFAILQSSGISVLESLEILSGTIGNNAISGELARVGEKLEEGRGISEPLRSASYFTPIVVNMVAIGEESGNLSEMLNDVAEHYDSEMEYGMTRLSEAIGPILTLGLAGVVGFFALSIFLPMWDITQMLK